jgi:serine/threonine protein kinase
VHEQQLYCPISIHSKSGVTPSLLSALLVCFSMSCSVFTRLTCVAPNSPALQRCAMDAYQKGPIIGEGTYGSVICATHKASGRRVAIKKVRMASGREGVNMSVLRELKALQALQGPHVVELLDVFTTKSSLVLVFEYMDCRWAEQCYRPSSSAINCTIKQHKPQKL